MGLRPVQLLSGALLFASFGPLRARAGNDEGILVGGQAALRAGAVTATVSDGTAAWYNPAGLARSKNQTLDVNASLYGFSLQTVDDFFVLPDGTTADASTIDWQLVPTALSYTRQLGSRWVGAFGVFIPTTNDIDLRTTTRGTNGASWTLAFDQVRHEYDYIFSLGMRIRNELRWGVSLHGIYISQEDLSQVGVGTPELAQSPFIISSSHDNQGDYGVRLGAGVQWSPVARLDLGISVQTPTLTGFRHVRSTSLEAVYAGPDAGAAFASNHDDDRSTVWAWSTPFVVRMGVAYAFGPRQVMIDGSMMSSLEVEDRKFTGNLRIAGYFDVSERLAFGVGAFTDLSGERGPAPDFVGAAGGFRIARRYTIVEGNRPLDFATTLGGRFAYGFGKVSRAQLVTETDGQLPMLTRAKLHIYELALNLGGTVMF